MHRVCLQATCGLSYRMLALPVIVLLALVPIRASAADAEAMCFAGTGKPRIDVVMCSMALMPAGPLSRATLLTKRARARIELAEDERALKDLGEALAINPLSVAALTEKGRALRFLGRPKEARNALSEAIRVGPNVPRPRRIRGVLALTVGDYAAAISDLSWVIKTSPGRGASHALRGIAHYYLDDPQAALADFEEAKARDFGYAYLPLWIALAQERLGKESEQGLQAARAALLDEGDWPAPVIDMYRDPTTEAMETALKLADKGTPRLQRARVGQIHFLRGELHRLRDAPDKALTSFATAVRHGDPRTVEFALARQRLAAAKKQSN